MLLLRNKVLPNIKLTNIKPVQQYFIREILLFWTFVALCLKSVIFLGFMCNSNTLQPNLAAGFKNVHYPTYFISFIMVLLSFSFAFKGRKRSWFLFILNTAVTLLLFFDLMYFRAFGAFVSPYLLNQAANLENLSDSIFSMMSPWDCILFIDLLILLPVLIVFKSLNRNSKRNLIVFASVLIISAGYILYVPVKVNVFGKSDNMSRLFEVTWRPDITLLRLSPIGFHFMDAYIYWVDSKKLTLDEDEVKEIDAWFENKKENLPDNKYKALLKGKNLLFIQFESLENFVIGQKINNQEITPNINKLLGNSIYFSNINEQVHLGTSSDSDLMVNTSLYPVRNGSTFFRYPGNTYNSLPKLLMKNGFSTLAIHPDKGAYWNWMSALKSIGFEKCIDASHFKHDESIGLGLSDGSFLRQVKPIVTAQKQPFYIFMVTMTSHSPFSLPLKYQELSLPEHIEDTKLGGYFQSIHYTDKQIGIFLSELEKEGVLDNTAVVICGDHCGVHKFYSSQLSSIKPQESWWADNYNHIPMIVYNKNIRSEKVTTEGGQVDIMPTILYLMGVDEKEYSNTAMGRNLLKTKKEYSVLSNGTFKGPPTSVKEQNEAIKGLEISDKIIRSNYFKEYR
jgi:phosphoglycerol transferase MdoB-like AlkP superfamily enzyme